MVDDSRFVTSGRTTARDDCEYDDQVELIEWEQHLPKNLHITCHAKEGAGWKQIVNVTVDNYVPETAPLMLPPH